MERNDRSKEYALIRNGRPARHAKRLELTSANTARRQAARAERKQRLEIAYGMDDPHGESAFRMMVQWKIDLHHEKLYDPSSPMPAWEQVAQRFRVAIATGELERGDHMPSMFSLQDLCGISRPTIRQAYHQLAREGLIRLSGKGGTPAFVIDVPDRRKKETREREAMRVIMLAVMRCRRLGMTALQMHELFELTIG